MADCLTSTRASERTEARERPPVEPARRALAPRAARADGLVPRASLASQLCADDVDPARPGRSRPGTRA